MIIELHKLLIIRITTFVYIFTENFPLKISYIRKKLKIILKKCSKIKIVRLFPVNVLCGLKHKYGFNLWSFWALWMNVKKEEYYNDCQELIDEFK